MAMRVVILAGGKGTRLLEETRTIPKPMIEIGGQPLIEHIMEIYESQGFTNFIVATGYKGSMITAHFMTGEYEWERKLDSNSVVFSNGKRTVETVYTGVELLTGGRLKRLAPLLTEPFLFTYGDGVGNVDICKGIETFKKNGSLVTLTAVHPIGRFGSVETNEDKVVYFGEKVDGSNQWINGGFMVVDPKTLDYIKGDETNLEKEVLSNLASYGKMTAYKHDGFWMAVDSLRDKENLEEIIKEHGKIWLRKS